MTINEDANKTGQHTSEIVLSEEFKNTVGKTFNVIQIVFGADVWLRGNSSPENIMLLYNRDNAPQFGAITLEQVNYILENTPTLHGLIRENGKIVKVISNYTRIG